MWKRTCRGFAPQLSLAGFLMISCGSAALAEGAFDAALTLDPAAYTTVTVTLDGAPLTLRRYEATYVGQPVAMAAEQPARRMGPGGSPAAAETQTLENLLAYQSLVVFVPEGATDDAAIILNVNNAGWFASELREGIEDGGTYASDSDTDKAGAALAAGYVYVDVGTRGRGIVAADGTFPGHAPAAVVDTKAAIRWLRLNDAALPGSAERIVITGTSGGGGLSAVVAASGNSPAFFPYLAEIGAAGIDADGTSTIRDEVFATIAYCPITDLGHADMAYERLYRPVRLDDPAFAGTLADTASGALAAAYPAYLESLGIVLEDGSALTADTMPGALVAALRREVDEHLAEGNTIPAIGEAFTITDRGETREAINTWLTVDGAVVTDIDLDAYLRFVSGITALKAVPAFDRTANTGNEGVDGENTLFGLPTQNYSNFTEYGWMNNTVAGDGSGLDDTGLDWNAALAAPDLPLAAQLTLTNPMAFLNTDADAAPWWYVRHGMIDRDTSFAVELALYHAARMDPDTAGVDFELAWMRPNSGDYDVQEAYGWLAEKLETTPN